MLLVLLDNAVKYTPDGGRIGVDAKATDGHAIIEVTDTGIGIAEADRSRIFDRFYRADKARARESGGAGLGLSIARWIAHVHGGEIAVRSEVAQGSTFSVRLPLFPTKGA
jgi:signal transduction histidine kinase